VRGDMADSDVVLCVLENPAATRIAAGRVARESQAIVVVNASPPSRSPMMAQLAELADVIVVNESEAVEWHWPVPHLVITRGARGASYVADGREVVVSAPPVQPLDTTGAR